MASESAHSLEQIIDFCNSKWLESNEVPASGWPTPDMQTGKKMAYNDVLQFARTLLPETP